MRNLTTVLIFSSSFVISTVKAADQPQTGQSALVITVDPRQAAVFVDGELKGNVTPLMMYLSVGKHKVLIQQPGWQSQELEVVLSNESIANHKIALVPEKPPEPKCDPSQLALTRDSFETEDEFVDRGFEVISQLNIAANKQDIACQAGVAHLNKAGYDVKTKIFPLTITWQPWAVKLKLENKGVIAIPKNQARGLWQEGTEKPVFVLFDQINPTPTVNKMVLLGLQQQWEIKLQPKKEPKPKDVLISERYKDNGDGTVTDITTNFMWMRCSLGQTWKNNTCNDNPKDFRWDDAMAIFYTFAEHSDWRVPTKRELNKLVYCSTGKPKTWNDTDKNCEGEYQKPTIDAVAFPNTYGSYWTRTTTNSEMSLVVNFNDGSVHNINRSDYYNVRLVQMPSNKFNRIMLDLEILLDRINTKK